MVILTCRHSIRPGEAFLGGHNHGGGQQVQVPYLLPRAARGGFGNCTRVYVIVCMYVLLVYLVLCMHVYTYVSLCIYVRAYDIPYNR